MQHLLWVDVSNLSDNSIAVIIFIVAIVIVGCYLQIVIGRESVRRKIKKLRTLLHEYGIDAQLAEKHCPEERIGSRGRFIPGALAWVSGGDSAGVLNISTGPIGWVNLLEYQFGDSPTDNWYVYGIPDKRIHPGCPKVHLNSSWYSKTIGVKWEGNDHTTGLEE